MKVARVVPIFKSCERTLVSNYRPISNLSIFNKIFEQLTHKRMLSFLKVQNVLSPLQFGFMKDNSTTLAIFHLINDFLQTFHNRGFTIAFFIDFRKAFDAVNRELLLNKLFLYGFRGKVNDFLRSYLSDRLQYVNCSDCCSETMILALEYPKEAFLAHCYLISL